MIFTYVLTITTDTQEHAETVLQARIDYEEELLGFDYTIEVSDEPLSVLPEEAQ